MCNLCIFLYNRALTYVFIYVIHKNMNTLILTKKQQKVFNLIESYFNKYGYSPTIIELKELLKVNSLRTVTQYLEILEQKGFIYRKRNQRRGIELANIGTTIDSDTLLLPVVASAGCDNTSVFADERVDEYITIDKNFIPNGKRIKDMVVIKAIGNSMREAGIDNGDYVIVEKIENGQAQENDRVIAIIDDNIVIKRIHLTKDAVILSPESKDKHYKPIIMKKDFYIAGRVIDVVKMKSEEEIYYDYNSIKNI